MPALPNLSHEEFARDVADAINAGDGERYTSIMNSPDTPLDRPDVTAAEIWAIKSRVHELVDLDD